MSAIMALTLAGCGAADAAQSAVKEAADDYKEEQLKNLIDRSTTAMHSNGEAGKVETVYVDSDANGTTREIIVSDWLKNPDGEATISDRTGLTDIVNVKGKETYTEDGNGNITWDAEGADIYYQGHTDEALPIDVKVSYTLDGVSISPEDLAGKSGDVTIRFDYTNNSKQTVSVDDKEYDVYTPFAVVSGLMLDADKFSNVDVTGGKVISDADNYIVMGLALPGLKDSLDLDEKALEDLDIDTDEVGIPDHFEISAHTTDFELGMTMTMASSDMTSSLGLDDISDTDVADRVKADVDELNDGALSLVDGTGKVADGTQALKDGAGQVKDGALALKDGAGKLNDGARTLYEGAGRLNSGAGELYDGTKELNNGTDALYSGIVDYTDGAARISDGASSLANGAEKLKAGSSQLRKGFTDNDIAGNSKKLAAGASQVSAGVDQLIAALSGLGSTRQELTQAATDLYVIYNMMCAFENGTYSYGGQGTFAAYVAGSGYDSAEGFNAVASKYLGADLNTIDGLVGAYLQSKAAYEALSSADAGNTLPSMMLGMCAEATSVEMPAYGAEAPEDAYTEGVLTQDTGSDEAGADDNSENGNAGGESCTDDGNEGPIPTEGTSEGESEPVENIADVETDPETENDIEAGDVNAVDADKASDTEKESAQEKTIVIENTGMSPEQKSAAAAYIAYDEKFQNTKAGCYAVYSVLSQMGGMFDQVGANTDNLAALSKGASDVATGAAALAGGLDTIGKGIDSLDDGIAQLAGGANELNGGCGTLVSNNDKLVGGAGQLKDGASKLCDGAGTLYSGTADLYNGAGSLYSGTTDLYNGAGTLAEGTSDLYDGVVTLNSGAAELRDGMIRLDEEGIQKVYNLVDTDMTDYFNRLTAVKEAGENYTTFTGADESAKGSVKFIIKTDAVRNI